jgi:hypothetical protein
MNKSIHKILFTLIPLSFILLFISSGEPIIHFLEDTFLAEILFKLSFPNSIIFNLNIGYLAGIFIYILTTYIPNLEREGQKNLIAIRLIEQVLVRIDSLFVLILKCSEESPNSMDDIDSERFLKICKTCKLNSPTGSKKLLSESPLRLGDLILREELLNNWNFIKLYLNEIEAAAIYIDPLIYSIILRIKKSSIALTIDILARNVSNTDLEAWSKEFFELHLIRNELIQHIDKIKELTEIE